MEPTNQAYGEEEKSSTFISKQVCRKKIHKMTHQKHSYLTHSLIHDFETSPNSKKLQTTTEMWLLENFKIQTAYKTLWKKGEIAHFEQFHLFPQCFPKAFFFFNVLKLLYMEERVKYKTKLHIKVQVALLL